MRRASTLRTTLQPESGQRVVIARAIRIGSSNGIVVTNDPLANELIRRLAIQGQIAGTHCDMRGMRLGTFWKNASFPSANQLLKAVRGCQEIVRRIVRHSITIPYEAWETPPASESSVSGFAPIVILRHHGPHFFGRIRRPGVARFSTPPDVLCLPLPQLQIALAILHAKSGRGYFGLGLHAHIVDHLVSKRIQPQLTRSAVISPSGLCGAAS